MAYTIPRTWVAGEIVTAALLNLHVRDNISYLKTTPTFDGSVYINDSSNVNATIGLTVNQGGSDDEAFALKSSDVAHGVTAVTETDTYFSAKKASPTEGGVSLIGFSEGAVGAGLQGVVTAAAQTKSSAANGAVVLNGSVKSGTTVASLGVDGNILVVRDNGTTRFILDADGDSHQDVGTAWTTFDGEDDVAVLSLLTAYVTRQDDPLKAQFGAWLEQSREPLERLRLVTFNEDGRHFLNMSRLVMLLTGAVRQVSARLDQLQLEGPR